MAIKAIKLKYKLLVLALILPLTLTANNDYSDAKSLNFLIKNNIEEIIADNNITMVITDLSNNQEIFSHNPNRYMIPASIAKLFTATSALINFDDESLFSTKIYKTDDGVLIKFNHDPNFSYENYKELFTSFIKEHGKNLKQITLDLGDDRLPIPPPAWMIEDSMFQYGATPRHAIVNGNFVELELKLAGKGRKTPKLKATNTPWIKIDNQLTYQANIDNYSMQLQQFYDGNQYTITATGVVGATAPQYLKPAIEDVNGYLIVLTEHLVSDLGANFAAINTTRNVNAVKAKMVKRITSDHLDKLLAQTLKDSNNLVTESMFVKLGQITAPKAKDWRHVGLGNKKLLEKKLNIKLDHTDIHDGSGISHYHLTSANDINTLFGGIYQDTDLYQKLTANMANWHKAEGNLKYLPKLHQANANIKVYAKTGTTSQITNVAGLIELPDRAPLAFTFMSFNHPSHRQKIRKAYAQVVDLLIDYYSGNRAA